MPIKMAGLTLSQVDVRGPTESVARDTVALVIHQAGSYLAFPWTLIHFEDVRYVQL